MEAHRAAINDEIGLLDARFDDPRRSSCLFRSSSAFELSSILQFSSHNGLHAIVPRMAAGDSHVSQIDHPSGPRIGSFYARTQPMPASAALPAARFEFQFVSLEASLPFHEDVNRARLTQKSGRCRVVHDDEVEIGNVRSIGGRK
jgi:hypothetical protein